MNIFRKILVGNPYEKWKNKKLEDLTLKDKATLNRMLDKKLVYMGEND